MGKYMDYHKKFLSEGVLNPEYKNPVGLCCALRYEAKNLDLFEPTDQEWDHTESAYWGSGDNSKEMIGKYTPFRQNIVLFLAAMNNEL